MTRRLLSACLGAAALVGVLGVPARTAAKPPDLPMNQTDTVTPQAEPMRTIPLPPDVHVEVAEEAKTGSFAVRDVAAEELPSAMRVYDALPAVLPTPTLFQLRPMARRTLAGSLLFTVNPLLALMPTDKALDAPHDHPQRVAGEDLFAGLRRETELASHLTISCFTPGISWGMDHVSLGGPSGRPRTGTE